MYNYIYPVVIFLLIAVFTTLIILLIYLLRKARRQNTYINQLETDLNTLKDNYEKRRCYFDNYSDIIYVLSPEGIIKEINTTGCQVLGLDRRKIIGESARTFISPGYKNEWDDKFQIVSKKQNYRGYVAIISIKGREYICEYNHAVRYSNGQVIAIYGIARDITRKIGLVRLMAEQANRYKVLFELLPFGVQIIDPDGYIIESSKAAASSLGYRRSEIKQIHISDLLDKAGTQKFYKRFAKEKELLNLKIEIKMRHKSGRYIEVFLITKPLFDKNMIFTGLLMLYVNITDALTFNQTAHLQEYIYTLQLSEISAYTAIESLRKLGKLNRSIEKNAGKLTASFAPDAPEAETINKIIKQCTEGRSVIDRFKTPALRIQEFQPIEAKAAFKDATDIVASILPEGIQFQTKLELDAGWIFSDPTKIRQMLMLSVIQGFHRIVEKGSGQLACRIDKTNPALSKYGNYRNLQDSEYVEINLYDAGVPNEPGWPDLYQPDENSEISSPAENEYVRLYGLRQIVANHDGRIHIKQRNKIIYRIIISLPLCEKKECPKLSEKNREEISSEGNPVILYIDDEEAMVQMSKKFLSRFGYEVIGMTEGRQAVNKFRQNPERYDLIITDLVMSGMDGVALSYAIRDIRPEIPIIVLTGKYDDSVESIENITWIDKSLEPEKLIPIIEKMLGKTG